MENLDVVIEERTPIEVVLEVDKDGFTTAKKLYKWLALNGNVSSETAEKVIMHIASERPAWRESIQEYEAIGR